MRRDRGLTSLIQQPTQILGVTASLPIRDHPMHLIIRAKCAMHAHGHTGARWQVQHVTITQELVGTALIQNRPGIHARTHRKGNPRGDIRFDQSGDHIDGRPLGGQYKVNARGPRLLGDTRNQLLYLLAHNHHHVGEFVDHHDDAGQLLKRRVLLLLFCQLEHRVGLPHGV